MQEAAGEIKTVKFRLQRASDEDFIARVVTDSARSRRAGLNTLSRKFMREHGTALC